MIILYKHKTENDDAHAALNLLQQNSSICRISKHLEMTTLQYPSVKKSSHKNVLHGVTVPEPFVALEDPNSPETKSFVAAQQELFSKYMSQCGDMKARVEAIMTTAQNYAVRSIMFTTFAICFTKPLLIFRNTLVRLFAVPRSTSGRTLDCRINLVCEIEVDRYRCLCSMFFLRCCSFVSFDVTGGRRIDGDGCARSEHTFKRRDIVDLVVGA